MYIPDSYLKLSGAKYKKDDTYHNVIDQDKVDEIKKGGTLSLYA